MDKLLHFAISFVITVCLNTFMEPQNATLVAFLIGIGKEIYDHFNPPHRAEFGDILANAVGIIIANIVLGVIRWQALNTVLNVGLR